LRADQSFANIKLTHGSLKTFFAITRENLAWYKPEDGNQALLIAQ
jgi:hypothetical protein